MRTLKQQRGEGHMERNEGPVKSQQRFTSCEQATLEVEPPAELSDESSPS